MSGGIMSGLLEVQHSFWDFNFDEFAISKLQGRVHGFGSTESGFGCFVDFWGNVTGLCLEEVDEHPNCSYNEHSRAGPDEDGSWKIWRWRNVLKIPVFSKCFELLRNVICCIVTDDLRRDSVYGKLTLKKINYVLRISSTIFLKIEVSTVTVDEYNEIFAV